MGKQADLVVIDGEILDRDLVIHGRESRQVDFDPMRDVLRQRFDADARHRMDEHAVLVLDRERFTEEVQRHLGRGLLRQRHAEEVDVHEAAGARVAGDIVDQCRNVAVDAGERQ